MSAPGIPGWVRVQGRREHPRSIERQSLVFAPVVRLRRGRLFTDHDSTAQLRRASAFTLLELLIVVGIIGLLLVLIAPAFTTIRGGTDVTSAAYTIKGVLDTARTYAKANNTYTWIGFFEEDVSQSSPAAAGIGRLVMSIVASKDGTTVYNPNSQTNPDPIDPTKLAQVGKLVCPFWYPLPAASQLQAQYYFQKTLQFSPTGECRMNSTYDVRQVIEVGLLQTHGTAVPAPIGGGGSTRIYSGNVAAVQISGFGGSVKIYRR